VIHQRVVAEAYDVLAFYGVPKRHTIYIGKDGKVLFVDREIQAATSAEDIAAKLLELGIPARRAS
jgi:peroxiredoxin Q/BCP